MNKVCKIILVRHGESVNNRDMIIGQNSPLTDKGREQARVSKTMLADFNFEEVYSSTMQRAVETAAIIAARPVPPDHQIADLRERHYGELEGKSHVHLDKDHETRLSIPHAKSWLYKHAEGYESDKELNDRFLAALGRVAEGNLGKTVLVAAHGATIRTLLMKLRGLTYRQIPHLSFKNAGYVELNYHNGRFTIVKIVGHQI